jgi:cytochrome c2
MSRHRRAWQASLAASLAALAASACSDPQVPAHMAVPGGDARRGHQLVLNYGCGTCHSIDRVGEARGIVGPRLERMAERTMLAGMVANVPRNMVAWLVDPPAIDPDTAMPNMGISEAEARDIAAFLYTLGAGAAAAADQPASAGLLTR